MSRTAFSKLPVSFIENRGQTDAAVRYYAQGNRYAFYMTPSEVLMSFVDRESSANETQSPLGLALALRFVGSNPGVEPKGAELAPGVINDLRGDDPTQWHTQIPQFRDVVYTDLWPGIDLRLREQSGVLKYEFHVAPGASPADVQLAYGGAQSLAVGRRGRAADLYRTRRAAGLGPGLVPGHRRRSSTRRQSIRAGQRCRHGSLLVRRRSVPVATTNWSSIRV